MTWLEVKIHQEDFNEEVKTFWVGGSAHYYATGLGTRVYRAKSDAPASTASAFDASAGGVTVAKPGDAFSADRPRALMSNRKVTRIGPKNFEITVEFKDPTGNETAEDLLARPAYITSVPSNFTGEYAVD